MGIILGNKLKLHLSWSYSYS